MTDSERENDLASLRIAATVGDVEAVTSYRKSRLKKGDAEAVAIIDEVLKLRKIDLDSKKHDKLISRMMRL